MLVTKFCWTIVFQAHVNSYLVCFTQGRLQIVQHFYTQKELERFMRAAHTQCLGEIFNVNSVQVGRSSNHCNYSSKESLSTLNYTGFGKLS